MLLFRLTWHDLRHRLPAILAILVLQTLATLAALSLPDLNARIIDEGVAKGDTDFIWRTGAEMLGLALGQTVCIALAVLLGARVTMWMGARLRERLFRHIHSFAAHDLHAFGGPSLITRSTNDVQQVQMTTLMTFTIMISAPITGIGGIVMAIRQDAKLSALLLVCVPALALVIGLIMRRLGPLFALQQKRIDAMTTVLREELTGIRVIRAFVRQPFIRARYEEANSDLRDVALGIGTLFALMFPAVMLVISLSTVAVIWFGGHLIDSGDMQVGALTAFISYFALIFQSVMMAVMMFIMVPRANVAAGRITRVLATRPSVANRAEGARGPEGRWHFRLEGVALRHPGAEEPVFSGVDLDLAPGTTTAIVGATASGKSTLVALLPRLMDPTEGRVSVNGTDTRDIDLEALRRRIAVVPQKAHLFSGTIASNVSGLADPGPAERERVERALHGACATEFVSRLDDGIDHPVEAGGRNFSGGQRQRLTIARALYREADLYVFDDSFSALDQATDARLRAGLGEHTRGAAVVVVAQRISSILTADNIVVLENGGVVGSGTHEQLMESCPTYRDIVASQIDPEEVA